MALSKWTPNTVDNDHETLLAIQEIMWGDGLSDEKLAAIYKVMREAGYDLQDP